ncbi:hypothetical protein [Cellulomonas sp. NS3]|uniref:hypothetical protein n=1 Tax=Cellulomonas sp. NS3 TaxID=2973977 RepID=UPI0037C0A087
MAVSGPAPGRADGWFVEIDVVEPSTSNDVLQVRGVGVDGHRILRAQSPAAPNVLAAILLALRDGTGARSASTGGTRATRSGTCCGTCSSDRATSLPCSGSSSARVSPTRPSDPASTSAAECAPLIPYGEPLASSADGEDDPDVDDVHAHATQVKVNDVVGGPPATQAGDPWRVVFAVLKPARDVDPVHVVDVAEIAVFIGERFVLTVRHGHSDVLKRVRHELADPRGPWPFDHPPDGPRSRCFPSAWQYITFAPAAFGDDGEVMDDSTADFLRHYMEEYSAFVERVLAASAPGHIGDPEVDYSRKLRSDAVRSDDPGGAHRRRQSREPSERGL